MALKEQGIQRTTASEAQPVKGAGNAVLRFYQKDRLVTETGPLGDRRVLWTKDSAVAQLDGVSDKQLLQTDLPGSVLGMGLQRIAYSPYGHRPIEAVAALLGFNGQYLEPLIGGYSLGSGYRLYNPTLMRFLSPDYLSPFRKGGINTYNYCIGDPINHVDPDGRWGRLGLKFWKPKRTPLEKHNSTKGKLETVITKLLTKKNEAFSGNTQAVTSEGFKPGARKETTIGIRYENNNPKISKLEDRRSHLTSKLGDRGANANAPRRLEVRAYENQIESNYSSYYLAIDYEAPERTAIPDNMRATRSGDGFFGRTYEQQMADRTPVNIG